jgi:MipA family protein
MTTREMTRVLWNSAVLLGLGLASLAAQAELKPQWELGAGVAGLDFPVYRGADERRSFLLPVPYVQYRGDILQIDRDRVRGLLFRRDRVEMDISVNGSLPVRSSDTVARNGMPDIDPILEIGPSLNVHLYFDEKRRTNLDLRLPVRAALAVSFPRLEPQGWLFQPSLDLNFRNFRQSGWSLSFMAGLLEYFYDVAPQYATPSRPAYTAPGGYSGKQFIAALSRRFPTYWIGGFMKWDDLEGSAFMGSPLVTRREAFAVGFAVSWILSASDKMVEVSDD